MFMKFASDSRRRLWEGSIRLRKDVRTSTPNAFQDRSTDRNGFDLLAPHYLWMEWLLAGNALQKCRTAHLQRVLTAKSALILGQGSGRFVSEFLKRNEQASVACVDASARMMEVTRRRLQREGLASNRVNLIQTDVLQLGEQSWVGGPFDLVVTHFFLDCFRRDQLEKLLPLIAQQTTSNATWLIADFRVPERGFARRRAQIILRLAYAFFRVVTRLPAATLTAPDTMLKDAGFRLEQRLISQAGLLHSDVWTKG
jgi:ubiquinone/menaquinone biosynthesis C-methylase UbiE